MPRLYNPPLGAKKYKKYDQLIINQALEELSSNRHETLRSIALKYKISKSVLQRHNTRVMKPSGGQISLSIDIEEHIVRNLNVCSEWGYPLDILDLRLIIKTYLDSLGITHKRFKNNLPGRDYVQNFLKRHKDKISQRICQNIKRSRAAITPETITDYFSELHKSLDNVPLGNILNYDETNLSDDPGRKKVITKRGCKYPERVVNHSKASVSIMMAGTAEGELLPPYVCYKATHLYDTWRLNGPSGSRYNRTPSGWFDAEVFKDWVTTIVLPFFENKIGKKLLIGDNLSSHLSLELISLCKERDVHFVFLPANSTHITQPLDVAFFRPMKIAWRQILTKWKKTDGRSQTTVPKGCFPRLLKMLMKQLQDNAQNNLKAGFRKTGISPFNPDEVLSRLPQDSIDQNQEREAIDQSVLNLLKEMRFGTMNIVEPKKKRKLNVVSGYYQPAGPLIKESGAEAERALARYHPPPHYHPPHPPIPPVQYGPPYYPTDLCYGRYYRPPAPYHMPPQPDSQMVGVGSDPYPPPSYYGTPPCYQHTPQRFVEYRGCPCPLNSCPKNVHIGPATGKAPTGGGPGEVLPALAPPGAALRAKLLESAADTHGSGKDPPLGPEPPAAADAPHPCPVPAIGGASPKRELVEMGEARLGGEAGGEAGACPASPARPSPAAPAPPVVPRRARLGKAMARRELARDDTALLLAAPPTTTQPADADDDVLAVSPPACVPIDLSSPDDHRVATPLVDIKKENEGTPLAATRKTDAPALREQNSVTTIPDTPDKTETTKTVKRRYSRPKLEIDMKDVQLEDGCRTAGIGEHVKLQKRRKVSCEQTTVARVDTVHKEPKKKSQQTKRTPKTPSSEKKAAKRKLEANGNAPKAKKMLLAETSPNNDPRLKNVAALPDDLTTTKPKNRSALLLDNLIRKNSIDRADTKGLDKEINPAELFLNPSENSNQICSKKTNINNNIVETAAPVSGVRANTIAAVTQLIEKKLAYKNACKVEKVDSKVINNLKSVLKTGEKLKLGEENMLNVDSKFKLSNQNSSTIENPEKLEFKPIDNFKVEPKKDKTNINDLKYSNKSDTSISKDAFKRPINEKCLGKPEIVKYNDESLSASKVGENAFIAPKEPIQNICEDLEKNKKSLPPLNKTNGQFKNKSIERVAKLLNSKKPTLKVVDDAGIPREEKAAENVPDKDKTDNANTGKASEKTNGEIKGRGIEKIAKLLGAKKPASMTTSRGPVPEPAQPSCSYDVEKPRPDRTLAKRSKLSNEPMKKRTEKVVRLLMPKKPAIKTDEAMLVIEEACGSPQPFAWRRARRRRSGGRRARMLLELDLPDEPPGPPRWSNGWRWDSECYLDKVYLNNDSRLDKAARCYHRMTHTSGDSVSRGDCILLRASIARAQPFVARVASLWQNPEDGEMMVSLVWYYRPEHTEQGRLPEDSPDEVFASRHRDANSVACIEDKCYVLTFNEYCRYRKRLKAAEEGIKIPSSIVPPMPPQDYHPSITPTDTKMPPSVSPELVLFCRKVYDFRSKKLQMPNNNK